MFQGPLCPNLSQKVQAEVSQMANCNLSRVILLGGLSVNLNHLRSGVAFWSGPMKSWPEGRGGSPNSTYKNTPYRLDKLRSALAEARLKTYLFFLNVALVTFIYANIAIS